MAVRVLILLSVKAVRSLILFFNKTMSDKRRQALVVLTPCVIVPLAL